MKSCHKTDSAFLNVYFASGLFLCSWSAVLLDNDLYIFTSWGLASGFILVTAQAVNFTVLIPVFGIAKATGIISGVAIVTSVGWNAVLGESFSNVGLTMVGVAVVLAGLYGIIMAKSDSASSEDDDEDETSKEEGIAVTATEQAEDGSQAVVKTQAQIEKEWSEWFSTAHSILIATGTGILAGSVLIPMTYADEEFQGLVFIPSVAIGVLGFSLPVSYMQLYVEGNGSLSSIMARADFSDSFPSAALGGAVYSTAMAMNIKAIDALDYATAMVIMQISIVVAGSWGILLYSELQGKAAVMFMCSSAVLIGGAFMVGIYGTTK